MKFVQRSLIAGIVWICLTVQPSSLFAQTPENGCCPEVIALVKEHNVKLSAELRRIHRELAALRADLDRPGLKEVFSGIGYILGLFGAAAFVSGRRKR